MKLKPFVSPLLEPRGSESEGSAGTIKIKWRHLAVFSGNLNALSSQGGDHQEVSIISLDSHTLVP